MALRKPFVISTEGYHEEIPVADSLDVGGVTINASGSGIVMNSKKITGLADGDSASQDAATVAQVEALVATGNVFKEPVFSASQLIDGASGGIAALEAIYFAAQPAAGDTVVLYDGTNTRTYTFVANQGAESAATDVSIETDAATAMQRLATRANADAGNTWWLFEYHTPGEFGGADGEIHVIEEKTPADTLSTSRIYGTWATQASFQVIEFSDGSSVIQYNNGTAATASTSDPAGGRFGLSRAEATLIDGEVHLALDENAQFSWEDSAQQWNQISGVGAIPDATSASGGGVKGISTYDSDFGLSVTAGVAKIAAAASSGIKFVTGEIAVEPNDFAGTGLEDDGSDNLRLSTQGNGIAGGGGTTLSVDPDSETGGNTQPVSVGVNGVGLDISAIAGTGIEADGSANLRLATQGNGIAGGGGTTLSVDPDTETGGDTVGVSVTANGVGLDVSGIAGTNLEADGNGNLRIAASAAGDGLQGGGTNPLSVHLEATNPTLQITTDELGVKLKPSGGLAVDASGVYVTGSDEASRVENTLTTATDATSDGDPIYANGTNTVGKADASADAKSRVIGVIRTGSGAAGATPDVVSIGPCAGVLTGATANTPYYLASGGGLTTTPPSGGNRVILIGYALNTTDLMVRITDYGKKAA